VSRIFLGGIPFKAVESDLEDLFSELGYAPTNVKILMEREDPQRSRGFGIL
jgi:RNA recognition motif-containing protein